MKSLSSAEITRLTHTIAHRVGRFLERQGLLERDAENSYLASDAVDDDPMTPLLGHSITYRIAVGPQAGRKVFTLQSLPASDELFDDGAGVIEIVNTLIENDKINPIDNVICIVSGIFHGISECCKVESSSTTSGSLAEPWYQRSALRYRVLNERGVI